MIEDKHISVLIPALNEAETIPLLLEAIPEYVDHILVVDNGSSDDTAILAEAGGAAVVSESTMGYGQACLTGIKALPRTDIIVFLDADFCEDPSMIKTLCEPIIHSKADMALGSRMHKAARHALTFPQRFGNAFACMLMNLFWGSNYTDLGPFRAITPKALNSLNMQDPDFGWTVEMQISAAKLGLDILEINVPYRDRLFGKSKISGTISGVFNAGSKILYVIARELLRGEPKAIPNAKKANPY
ncbi:glycosyltransferase family 2 protein [Kordiimonas sp. SCSIO 12610]|uniref:glycosyltransferase family 2 protein n=1 Tax=Kordiimonas sp. SCSIO 12610 TaxID=2829597 RepID=UPI002108E73C|nr:glycosyltransferase family 2 protein [Kordiimonas sp. SCSIO 12610]UTW55914.1 glycosyltransferase family 2 protein [Kordiimonas sp. SCSIO 12610]